MQQCVPGCEELIRHSDTKLEAKVVMKIGPIRARFSGNIELNTDGAADNFSLFGKGNGGAAGYAKGGADVTLLSDGAETILMYQARAEIGGKIAQSGSRLIQGTAKQLAGKFFGSFVEKKSKERYLRLDAHSYCFILILTYFLDYITTITVWLCNKLKISALFHQVRLRVLFPLL